MYLIRSRALNGLDQLLKSLGYDINRLEGLIDINLNLINQPNHYLSYELMAELLELCAEQSDCSYLGFELAKFQGINALDDLIVSVSQKESIGNALEMLDRYLYLHASGVHVKVIPYGSYARVVASFHIPPPNGIDQLAQLSIGIIANILTRLIGNDGKRFKLHLRQSKQVTGCCLNTPYVSQVQFDSEEDCVIVDMQRLSQKPCVNLAETQSFFQIYLASLQERYPNDLVNQVKEVIGGYLPTGECDIQRVSVSLGIHQRTLQRQLKLQKTSYGQLLQKTRHAIAEQHLRHSHMSITDLALSLGYSEISAFSRHFKDWSGKSPRQWRLSHRKK